MDPRVAEIVAGLEGVHAEVISTAQRGARLLKKNIRNRTGAMARSVRAEALGDKDAFFGIGDEGAIGYNFGHHNTWSDTDISGSRVIERTIGEM
ncbi:hypothetical protein SAMN05216275_10576 [Streptosporangium canum]|uniref:Uncharacterized protein n=1 Tax=Streptosporangium canum TaxID=324952 RepID=A0A1I3LAY3_9ACTN|nr:hypothetical protein [Streptosporangium canum]SFI81889.1 hypothetical protein SAMN05216275_10576 [Streptosporangium canum]